MRARGLHLREIRRLIIVLIIFETTAEADGTTVY
jgi:hypothetical protein